jgi:nucleotidyltransferase/DNA polymerase involved in DNA repair
VEQREQPALAQVPMAVGGIGMICTANYEVSLV